jgi:hypothetical protein
MALDPPSIVSGIDSTATAFVGLSWDDMAEVCKGQLAALILSGGGVASFTRNGTTVTHDADWWTKTYQACRKMAAADAVAATGGIVWQDSAFAGSLRQ